MSTKHAYRLAIDIADRIREHPDHATTPRILIDAWATLYQWHRTGEQAWRITPEQAQRLLDEPLPADIPLATATTRAPAMLYQLPERRQWILLARHQAHQPTPSPAEGPAAWAFAQPLLTYCTTLEDGTLAAGHFNLLDQPTPATIAEEDYRVSLAIAQHYRPR